MMKNAGIDREIKIEQKKKNEKKRKEKRSKDCKKMRARKSEIRIWRVLKEGKQMVKKALNFLK